MTSSELAFFDKLLPTVEESKRNVSLKSFIRHSGFDFTTKGYWITDDLLYTEIKQAFRRSTKNQHLPCTIRKMEVCGEYLQFQNVPSNWRFLKGERLTERHLKYFSEATEFTPETYEKQQFKFFKLMSYTDVKEVLNRTKKPEYKSYGLKRFRTSRIVAIDIDGRNNPHRTLGSIIQQVIAELGEPFYLEFSFLSRGVHLYFKFDSFVPDSKLKDFESYMSSKYNVNLETLRDGRQLRLPYSIKYNYAGPFFKPSDHFKNEEDYRKNFLDLMKESYNSGRRVAFPLGHSNRLRFRLPILPIVRSFHQVVWLFENSVSKPLPSILKGTPETIQIRAMRTSLNQKSAPQLRTDLSKFEYGAGTRSSKQPVIALYVKQLNGTFDDFVRLCDTYNVGNSHDMFHQSPCEVEQMLQQIWAWAEKNFKPAQPSSVVNPSYSSLGYEYTILRAPDQFELSSPVDYSLFKNLFEESYDGNAKGKIGKRHFVDALVMYEFLREKQLYDIQTKKRYDDPKLKDWSSAVLFNAELRRQFAKENQILAERRILNILTAMGLVTPARTESGHLWSYKNERFARHWFVQTPRKAVNARRKLIDQAAKLKGLVDQRRSEVGLKKISSINFSIYSFYSKPYFKSSLNSSLNFSLNSNIPGIVQPHSPQRPPVLLPPTETYSARFPSPVSSQGLSPPTG